MKLVALYHPKSDHGGVVMDYAKEFENHKKKPLELVSLETIEGADMANIYDVTQYPAFLVIRDDGSLLRLWQGTTLPLMDELSYYDQDSQPTLSHVARKVEPAVTEPIL
jgi:hypothetical protein